MLYLAWNLSQLHFGSLMAVYRTPTGKTAGKPGRRSRKCGKFSWRKRSFTAI